MVYLPDENIQDALLTYLSELTLTDEEPMGLHPLWSIPPGLHLPKRDEFHVISWRLSKLAEYTAITGFNIILSENRAWEIGNKDVTETVSKLNFLSHLSH